MSVPTTSLKNYYPGVGTMCAAASDEIQDGSITAAKLAAGATTGANPMTAVGDIIYGGTVSGGTAAPTRRAGNTTTTPKVLMSTGTGSAAQAPAWGTLLQEMIPSLHATTGGVKNAYTATIGTFTAIPTGVPFYVTISATNDAASTLNVNSIGTKAIVAKTGSALSGGELVNGSMYCLVYNGTSFVLVA